MASPATRAGQAALAPGSGPARLADLLVDGGTRDDVAFARAALGLTKGAEADEARFRQGLDAVRATDRFRTVAGRLETRPDGMVAHIQVEPWPALDGWTWEGDAPAALRKALLPELRKGARIGALRLEQWRERGLLHLRESGYPEAQLQIRRAPGDRRLVLEATLGRPALVQRVDVTGDPAPYGAERLVAISRLQAGKSLWTQESRRQAMERLRRRFLKDKRYEWKVDLVWSPEGVLRLDVDPGPVVELERRGSGLGWTTRIKDMVPLARAERYSPELLAEGQRRILRHLVGQGYLDASVTYRREVTKGSADKPQRVRVTYFLEPGERTSIDALGFERNQEISDVELRKAASLPSRLLTMGSPRATPELLGTLEDRIKALYLGRGYTDVSLRRRFERKDGRTSLVFTVREGGRKSLRSLTLALDGEGLGEGWGLAECLPMLFSERLVRDGGAGKDVRRYRSDRPAFAGLVATIQRSAREGGTSFRLATSRPLPFVKSDLAQVFSLLRQRISSMGVLRPQERLRMDATEDGLDITIEVPRQEASSVQRLAVQGCDKTRARAVLRETRLEPGAPLDPERLSKAQAQVGNLGAFQRVDLMGLGEAPGPRPEVPWKEGDLLLRVEERSPWVVSSSFGYDKSQGYHLGLGVQRLNVGGMGRTLDFGIRAGDGTIGNPTLRKWFPTGEFDRSVDMYSVGYTDPWFAPGFLEGWLPERAQFRLEAAYIQERRSAYLIRRRRVPASLEWRVSPQVLVQAGYRYERVEVKGAVEGIREDELNNVVRSPRKSIISAPFAQVVRDTRDNPYDPTRGAYSVARVEMATQLLGTSKNSSFLKLDLRNQWNWPLGYKAAWGVVAFAARVGVAHPTENGNQELPLSERFFAGGPFSHRGVEPDELGPHALVPLRAATPPYDQQVDEYGNPRVQKLPLGGQGLALVNLEYRFPILRQALWGEVFVDSGQVYQCLGHRWVQKYDAFGNPVTTAGGTPLLVQTSLPPFRTSLGLGLIWKLGIPIKIEYAMDYNRIFGGFRSQDEKDTQLKGLLISAGFQF